MKPQALDLSRVPPAWEQGCPGTSLGRYLLLSLVFFFFFFLNAPCNTSKISAMAFQGGLVTAQRIWYYTVTRKCLRFYEGKCPIHPRDHYIYFHFKVFVLTSGEPGPLS